MTYVINFAKFGVDRVGLGSGKQSNIKVLPLLEKSSIILHGVAAHAVIME